MGNSTSQKLFKQYQSKPSNRARDQLWHYYYTDENLIEEEQADPLEESQEGEQERDKTAKLFYQSKEYLNYKQSETFLSELYDYLRTQDEKRKNPSRSWDDKEVILRHWLRAFGSYPQPESVEKTNTLDPEQHSLIIEDGWEFVEAEENPVRAAPELDRDVFKMTRKNFYFALLQLEVETKIDACERLISFAENWEVLEATSDVGQGQVDALVLNQIEVLMEKGAIAAKKQCYRIAAKKYQLALNIAEGYLADMATAPDAPIAYGRECPPTVLLMKKKLFDIKRKIEKNSFAEEELISKTSGVESKTFESMTARPLFIIAQMLLPPALASLKCTSKFFNNALYSMQSLMHLSVDNGHINWKNLNACVSSKESFSILSYLYPELQIQIFAAMPFNDRLSIRATSKGFKQLVDEMLKAEFEAMHLNNFVEINEKIVEIGEGSYSERAVELSGSVGLGMLKVGGEMAKATGSLAGSGIFGLVYLGVVLGVCTVGGIIFLESAIGGPISGSIGKLVEIASVSSVQGEKIEEAQFCHHCDKELSFFSSKWVCRACRATFCPKCQFNELVVLVKQSTFKVLLCDKCHKLIDLQYDQKLSESGGTVKLLEEPQ